MDNRLKVVVKFPFDEMVLNDFEDVADLLRILNRARLVDRTYNKNVNYTYLKGLPILNIIDVIPETDIKEKAPKPGSPVDIGNPGEITPQTGETL